MPNYIKGIDLSYWEGKVDLSKAKALNTKFVYTKASQQEWMDSTYYYNRENTRKNDLRFGSFHFLTWAKKGLAQARYFWSVIKDDPGEMPIGLDYEWVPKTLTSPSAIRILHDSLEELKQLSGFQPSRFCVFFTPGFWNEAKNVINTSADWNLVKDEEYWNQYSFWFASPGNVAPTACGPWKQWLIWQWSWKGDGYAHGTSAHDLDMNYIKESDWNKYFNHDGNTQPVPIPEVPLPEIGDYELKMKVVVDTLNVRTGGPGMGFPILERKYKGDIVVVYDVRGRGSAAWVKIDPNSEKYCCAEDNNIRYLQKI